jgi:hypothetical protein
MRRRSKLIGMWQITEEGNLWMGSESRPLNDTEKNEIFSDLAARERELTKELFELAEVRKAIT